MRRFASFTVLALVVASAGCYHAVIDTGLTPGKTVIDQPWAMSFVAGLVPPPVVMTASQCPSGVSKVVTEHSFLNALVGAITFEIITPMHINVTCAAGRREALAPIERSSRLGLQRALEDAARRSLEDSRPVYVQLAN
jgi:hypothetical protein